MEFQGPYKLEINVIAPKKAIIDSLYHIRYEIKNLSEVTFPGGLIRVEMYWATIGKFLVNNHPMSVEELEPDGKSPFDFDQAPEIAGMTVLMLPAKKLGEEFVARDGKSIRLLLPNGNEIPMGQVIHSIRVQSSEEISQAKNNKIAAVSLVILIIFQILDWLIRYFGHI